MSTRPIPFGAVDFEETHLLLTGTLFRLWIIQVGTSDLPLSAVLRCRRTPLARRPLADHYVLRRVPISGMGQNIEVVTRCVPERAVPSKACRRGVNYGGVLCSSAFPFNLFHSLFRNWHLLNLHALSGIIVSTASLLSLGLRKIHQPKVIAEGALHQASPSSGLTGPLQFSAEYCWVREMVAATER
jgi:hypothetical protein